MHLDGAQEPVLGAGAAAVLLSTTPQVVEYDARVERRPRARGGRHLSPRARRRDRRRGREPHVVPRRGRRDLRRVLRAGRRAGRLRSFFAANIYHVPFGGLAQRAHLRLARRELDLTKAEVEGHWSKKSRAVADVQPPHGRRVRRGDVRRAGRADRAPAVAARRATESGSTRTARDRARNSTARVWRGAHARRWPRRVSSSSCRTGGASPWRIRSLRARGPRGDRCARPYAAGDLVPALYEQHYAGQGNASSSVARAITSESTHGAEAPRASACRRSHPGVGGRAASRPRVGALARGAGCRARRRR